MGECKPDNCTGGAPCLDGNVSVKAKYKSPKNRTKFCKAKCPEGFTCTRVKGHKGEHEAQYDHEMTRISCARWYDEL